MVGEPNVFRGKARPLVPAVWLIALVVLAYLPALRGGFIWDDGDHVIGNPCVVGPLGLKDLWTTRAARICPLTQTTFWLEYKLWGRNPLPYHVVNILMHAGSAVLLWQLLRCLAIPGAWLGAAWWALHPVQAESVAWITELKNTQSGFFYLLTGLLFVKSLLAERSAEAAQANRLYMAAVVTAALAVTSKSSTVVLPVVLGLCAWWVDGRWHWRRVWRLLPIAGCAAAMGVVSMWTQKLEGAAGPEYVRSWADRMATSGKVFWFYLHKLLWPHPLMFVYPRWSEDAARIATYLPFAAMAVVLVTLWWKRNTPWGRAGLFAAAYFLAALAPVLGILNHFFLRYSFVGDHFQYLASMGPPALLGAGAAHWLRDRPRWLTAAGGIVLALLGGATWRHAGTFHDDETLWRDALAKNPAAWMAHNNLGHLLLNTPGRLSEAMAHLEEGLRIKPDNPEGHYNLGTALEQAPGRLAEAIEHYEIALRLRPEFADVHNNLGTALEKVPGRLPEAIAHYEAALSINPEFAAAHYNLGKVLADIPGRGLESMAHYEAALRIKPDFPEASYNLAIALERIPGRQADAIARFEAAVRANPGFAQAHYNLANALSRTPGREPEALAHYAAALQAAPEATDAMPGIQSRYAAALVAAGQPAEAETQARAALRADPSLAQARITLAVARLAQGDTAGARTEFAAVVARQPGKAAGYLGLAQVAEREGRWAEAQEAYEQAVRAEPDFAGVHFALAQLLERQGRPAEAAGAYREELRRHPNYAAAQERLRALEQGEDEATNPRRP